MPIFGPKPRWFPHETLVVETVLEHVDQTVSEALSTQLGLINKIQRTPSNRGPAVQLYRTRWGRPVANRGEPVDTAEEETLLATVKLRSRDDVLECRVCLVHGRISSLEFSEEPPRSDTWAIDGVVIHPEWARP